MLLITNKDEISFAGKHVDNVGNDRLAINFNQRLGYNVACAAKSFTETGHRDDYLHTFLVKQILYFSLGGSR